MSDDLSGVHASGLGAIAEELRLEVFDEAKEQVTELSLLIDGVHHDRNSTDELRDAVSKAALKLRTKAGTAGLRLIGTIAHRLEDYMANLREFQPRTVDDLQMFIDRLEDIIEERIALDADASQIVRKLPSMAGFSEDDIEVRNIEVMLVMLHGTANHYVQRELQQCGYRVTTVSTVFEAFQLVVQTKPDLIVISAIMPELDGIDLAIGLSAMPATRNIPLALISGLDTDDEHFALVPSNVPIIRKGPAFGDDLYTALDNLFLI